MVPGSCDPLLAMVMMLEKQKSGYRVTLQTILTVDSAELEVNKGDSSDSGFDSCMKASIVSPIRRVRKRRAEMAMSILRQCGFGVC